MENLPKIARSEVAAGLTGPLREEIARTQAWEDAVEPLRDRLVRRLSGQDGYQGAIVVADRIHLGRLVNQDVPAIVAVYCLGWYGSYRDESDPYYGLVQSLLRLYTEWVRDGSDRPRISDVMRAEAAAVIGEHPMNLIDIPV